MTDLKSFLRPLFRIPGISGYEAQVAHFLEENWRPYTDDLSLSGLDTLYALILGSESSQRPSVMFAGIPTVSVSVPRRDSHSPLSLAYISDRKRTLALQQEALMRITSVLLGKT